MAVNSSFNHVKEYLDRNGIPYEGHMGSDNHYRFKIRCKGDLKVISTSLHKGERRSCTYVIVKIKSFFKTHGIRLPNK